VDVSFLICDSGLLLLTTASSMALRHIQSPKPVHVWSTFADMKAPVHDAGNLSVSCSECVRCHYCARWGLTLLRSVALITELTWPYLSIPMRVRRYVNVRVLAHLLITLQSVNRYLLNFVWMLWTGRFVFTQFDFPSSVVLVCFNHSNVV
jgi:hypothetical protein